MKFRLTNGPHRAAAKVGFSTATRIWSQPTRGCRHTRSRVDAAAVPDPLAGIWEGEIMPVLKPRRVFARCSRRDTQSSYIAALNMIAIDPGEARRRAGGETGRCHPVRLSRRCAAHHLHHERIESLNAENSTPFWRRMGRQPARTSSTFWLVDAGGMVQIFCPTGCHLGNVGSTHLGAACGNVFLGECEYAHVQKSPEICTAQQALQTQIVP
jgi:hypothetical protein